MPDPAAAVDHRAIGREYGQMSSATAARRPRCRKLAALAAVASLVSACGTNRGTSSGVPPETSAASETTMPQPSVVSGPPPAPPPHAERDLTPASCGRGRVDFSGEALPAGNYRACVAVGTILLVRLAAPVIGTWGPFAVDQPTRLRLRSRRSVAGRLLAATFIAGQAGSVRLSAASVTADPHGPPTMLWSLQLTIEDRP
jgi:hypothetical protein